MAYGDAVIYKRGRQLINDYMIYIKMMNQEWPLKAAPAIYRTYEKNIEKTYHCGCHYQAEADGDEPMLCLRKQKGSGKC